MELNMNEQRVLDYMNENPTKPLTVTEGSEILNIGMSSMWSTLKTLYRIGKLERHNILIPRGDGVIDGRKVNYVYHLPGMHVVIEDGKPVAVKNADHFRI